MSAAMCSRASASATLSSVSSRSAPAGCAGRARCRQHHRPVLLDLGELVGHAVEADVDLADFAGGDFLVKAAGVEVAIANASRREGELLERLVDEACNHGRTGQRQHARGEQPDQPGLAVHG
jgi:hypothetical protein